MTLLQNQLRKGKRDRIRDRIKDVLGGWLKVCHVASNN